MSLYVSVNGVWKNTIPYVPVAGAWRQAPQIYVPVNGTWRAVYSYYWAVGGWGGCSVACGGGVQYRSVVCRRAQDNLQFGDNICSSFGAGGKPSTSQACNTGKCPTAIQFYVTTDCGTMIYHVVWNGAQYAWTGRTLRADNSWVNLGSLIPATQPKPWYILVNYDSKCGGSNYSNVVNVSGGSYRICTGPAWFSPNGNWSPSSIAGLGWCNGWTGYGAQFWCWNCCSGTGCLGGGGRGGDGGWGLLEFS